jgi:hypothetical protein
MTNAEIGESSLARRAASITYQEQFVVGEIHTMDSVMWPANCLQTSLIARTFLDNAQA